MQKQVALFVMPRSSSAWKGSEALWITVAGWASAAEHKFGEAWILTSDRCATPKEVIHFPLEFDNSGNPTKNSLIPNYLPGVLVTLIKDVRLWYQSRKHGALNHEARWAGKSVAFVWEHHDIFPGPGKKLASMLGVPFIKYVHAPQVWESSKWNVHRPLWGALLEKYAEAHSLKQADLVACVSSEVADKVFRMGVMKSNIVVTPMAADPAHFITKGDSNKLREELQLEGSCVIGWIGSFRSFHGLDILIMAFKKVCEVFPSTKLVLVGDGIERQETERLITEQNLERNVLLTGRINFAQIPLYIQLFDIAVVSARSANGFHYSPLKLREYLVSGKPTLAPRAGEIPEKFVDGEHVSLYTPGDVGDTAEGLLRLLNDKVFRDQLAIQGKAHALINCTWLFELEAVMKNLYPDD